MYHAWLAASGLEPTYVPDETPSELTPTSPSRCRLDRSMRVQRAIDLAIEGMYDATPEWDEDDDLALPSDHCAVLVVVSNRASRVLMHCTLVDGIENAETAMAEVNRLNRAEFGLTSFVADEGRVAVTREIGLDAVVPTALRVEIDRLVGNVD